MRLNTFQHWQVTEKLLSFFVFLILVSYTYALWVLDPFPGFAFNSSNGRIVEVYAQPEQGTPTLQINDVLVQIGPISWETYKKDATVLLFEGVQAGEIIEITVNRNGQEITIPWQFAGFDSNVLKSRLLNIWVLAFFFWLAGTTTLVLIRPRDTLRNLFVIVNYLTALWLIFGMLSYSHIWLSSILLHASTWILLPVYLHFHWIFPRPLKQFPKIVWGVIYFISLCFVIAEFFQALPKSLYALAFLMALLGSFILEAVHFIKHKDQRREVAIVAIGILIAFLPILGLGLVIIAGSVPNIAPLALFALPFMSLTYFYVIYRRQMGGLEVRLNRFISLYAFLILFGTILFILIIPLTNFQIQFETAVVISILVVLVLIYIAITTFPKFQTFIERRYLGIRLNIETLREHFSNRITASTSSQSLLQLLKEDVFPSLFIQQYAFVQVENQHLHPLLLKNVTQAQLPEKEAIQELLTKAGKYLPYLSSNPEDWLRLILPLKFGDSTLGFFLLGRRDPDDLYHQSEIPILQSIANQTAIAWSNIVSSEQLKQMYQFGVERYEQERLRLAHDLHDVVLNELGDMRIKLGELSPELHSNYQALTLHLREIIDDLRPPMLTHGLVLAIQSLAENLMQKTGDTIKIKVDLQAAPERLPENIEVHLFRIVQEACNNVDKHAKAKYINIRGSLSPDKVDLLVEDDGIGFEVGNKWELSTILANRHFGLAGMIERAYIIGAVLDFQSHPNRGTKIQIQWSANIH